MNRECDAEDEEVLRAGIRRYFPDADGPTLAMKTCMFTNSPDEQTISNQIVVDPRTGRLYNFYVFESNGAGKGSRLVKTSRVPPFAWSRAQSARIAPSSRRASSVSASGVSR